jgi:divalent metal cation (Fe/Co/Zn/Cd) transporter
VDLVADVDGDVTLSAAHEIADRIEEAVKASHPDVVDVVVHLEPTPLS